MKKHLDGLAQWDSPEAGMFFWWVLRLPVVCLPQAPHVLQGN